MEGGGQRAPPPAASAEQRQFNERNRKDLTAADIRFTAKNGAVYAFLMGWPESAMQAIPQLALGGNPGTGKIRRVELLGHKGNLKFTQNETALSVELPREKPSDYAVTLEDRGRMKLLLAASLFVISAWGAANPLLPLSAAEIRQAVRIVNSSGRAPAGSRFSVIALKEPPKDAVLKGTATPAPRFPGGLRLSRQSDFRSDRQSHQRRARFVEAHSRGGGAGFG